MESKKPDWPLLPAVGLTDIANSGNSIRPGLLLRRRGDVLAVLSVLEVGQPVVRLLSHPDVADLRHAAFLLLELQRVRRFGVKA